MPAEFSQEAWFDAAFAGQQVMAILRGFDPQSTVNLCARAWDLGITQVEVPVQSPDAMSSLHAAIGAARERGTGVGAGTVTSIEQLQDVAAAGVTFTVAPGLDEAVLTWSTEHGLAHLPGVSTPTEVQRALRLGARWLKVFPANVLGPAWFRAVLGPFPRLKLVATGGMTVDSVALYRAAGARIISLGSALQYPEQLAALGEVLSP